MAGHRGGGGGSKSAAKKWWHHQQRLGFKWQGARTQAAGPSLFVPDALPVIISPESGGTYDDAIRPLREIYPPLNPNLSALVDPDTTVTLRNVTEVLRDLQRLAEYQRDRRLYHGEGIPQDKSSCQILRGQYLHFKPGETEVRHNLARIPAGIIWIRNDAGSAEVSVLIEEATLRTVPYTAAGGVGTFSVGILI